MLPFSRHTNSLFPIATTHSQPLLSKRIMSSDRLSATHTPALKSFASSESTSSGAAGGGGVDGVVEKGAAADDVGGGGGFQTMPTTWVSAADPAWNSASVVMVYDSELDASNPVEDMNRMLMHDILRGQMDPDLKPNTSQKEQIEEILNSPKVRLRERASVVFRLCKIAQGPSSP